MIRSAALLTAVYAVLSIQSSPGADWPLFRGDARMTGVSSSKLPDKLDERWTFKCKDAVESAPAIADGVVYVASADKHLYALDLALAFEGLGTFIRHTHQRISPLLWMRDKLESGVHRSDTSHGLGNVALPADNAGDILHPVKDPAPSLRPVPHLLLLLIGMEVDTGVTLL